MSLTGQLDVDASADEVSFSFTVTNDDPDPVDLQFSNAQTHDVLVVEDGDTAIWSFAEGRMFAQMLTSRTLDAGESVTYDCAWDDPEPGSYIATAFLAANNADCEASAEFSV
ncbi:BsuPI-related putative proteinase inhibitor [Haloarchaeobius iranensis]|uniref:Intracellular proteinase inhibitor n=1 Tax=Haloarchaeobius iranensis TaxID=996166 RepID=A0A1G9WQ42_9EURY|nr:BsuPI-related putative proteinase inhibitor [Haloarchaeobius iranensis]SDM86598.1 Intracellular proteinase inhibitor [Haloarchaeobius iranensis]